MKRKLVKRVLVVVVGLFVGLIAFGYWTSPSRLTTAPEYSGLSRSVTDNILISDADPAIRMQFDEKYEYIGGQKFELYGTCEVEQHFFVEENPDGSLRSFFWVQFEGFLPDNDYTYDYSNSPLRLKIGDFDFFTDAEPGKTGGFMSLGWPGTDGYLARKFAFDKGYKMPDHFSYARIVHIPDEASRKELLIIFIDDLKPLGLTSDELRKGGDHSNQWSTVQADHLDKIKDVMKLSNSESNQSE